MAEVEEIILWKVSSRAKNTRKKSKGGYGCMHTCVGVLFVFVCAQKHQTIYHHRSSSSLIIIVAVIAVVIVVIVVVIVIIPTTVITIAIMIINILPHSHC
jgi:hypothetical protein